MTRYITERDKIYLKLKRIASSCSLRAGEDLHPINDDLIPWLKTNEDIDEYLNLLDILTLMRR